MSQVPSTAQAAVLKSSINVPFMKDEVKGYEWKKGINYDGILKSYLTTGLQATNFGLAVNEINKMLECRKLPLPQDQIQDNNDPFTEIRHNCTIFLGYTSNIVSSGLRETIRFLVQHSLVGKPISRFNK